MPEQQMTEQQILGTITAARDSVWVVNDSLAKLANGETLNEQLRGNIDRNVGHLKLVVGNPQIVNSGQNIDDLHQAITDGEAALA